MQKNSVEKSCEQVLCRFRTLGHAGSMGSVGYSYKKNRSKHVVFMYVYIYVGKFQERTLLLSVHLTAAEDGTAAMFTA